MFYLFLRHINRQCPWGQAGELCLCLCAPLTNSLSARSKTKPSRARQIAGTIPDPSLAGPISSPTTSQLLLPSRLQFSHRGGCQPPSGSQSGSEDVHPWQFLFLQSFKLNSASTSDGYLILSKRRAVEVHHRTLLKLHPQSTPGSPPIQAHFWNYITSSTVSVFSHIKELPKREELQH